MAVPGLFGNAANLLMATAASTPRGTALVDGDETVDYASLVRRTGAVAAHLHRLGVRPGERVALYARRDTTAAAAYFGILAAGAVAVIVNETLRPRQIRYIVDHAQAGILLVSDDLLQRAGATSDVGAVVVSLAEVPESAEWTPVPRLEWDVAQIIFTSGSTGLPKGVALSHGNLWAGVQAVVAYLGIVAGDRIASLLPFSFDYGLNQLLCSVATGATLIVERHPVPQRIVQTLRRRQVSVLAAVPPLWLQLLGTEDFARALPALRIMTNTGGSLPRDAVRKLRRSQPHAELVLMYGLTEAFRSCYLSPERVDRKPGSVGQAIPGAEVLLLNEAQQPCAVGEVGELVHRGPTVALGYWNDPEATAQRFRPNPLRPPGTPEAERVVFSGDYMYRDAEGDLYFVGRRDTLIKTQGYRVSPDEVVNALYDSGELVEAVVDAEPDPVRGSRIVAYVVLRPGGRLERLRAFIGRELPRYMQPCRIEARAALERTPSGKHDLRAVRSAAHDAH